MNDQKQEAAAGASFRRGHHDVSFLRESVAAIRQIAQQTKQTKSLWDYIPHSWTRWWRVLWKKTKNRRHKIRGPLFFTLWICWVLIGTFFYAYAPDSNLGLIKG